jgi:hypothetical protein
LADVPLPGRAINVAHESAIFIVKEAGERTVVGIRDCQSFLEAFCGISADSFACETRQELEHLVSEHQTKTLAIDVSSMGRLPSAFMGILVALSRRGVQSELLSPSLVVRHMLEVTGLDQFFAVKG